MVNEQEIIKYNRTNNELQELALFLVAVAGKNANTTARMLDDLLKAGKGFLAFPNPSPFRIIDVFNTAGIRGEYSFLNKKGELEIREYGDLPSALKAFGFGCQSRLAKAFTQLSKSKLNLRTCSRDDLLTIHGIGLKSANCFISWTRKNTKMAMLDTHLMKFIRLELGYTDAPKATPSSKRQYEKWEKVFLDYCEENNLDPTEEDLRIWKNYSKRPKTNKNEDL